MIAPVITIRYKKLDLTNRQVIAMVSINREQTGNEVFYGWSARVTGPTSQAMLVGVTQPIYKPTLRDARLDADTTCRALGF